METDWDTSLNGSDTSLKLITWDGEHCDCGNLLYVLGTDPGVFAGSFWGKHLNLGDHGSHMYTRQWVGIWNQASLNPTSALSLAGCAVLDKLLGHYELWFPCLSAEIRCAAAVSNGFNHAWCEAHVQGVAQGKSPCVVGGAPIWGAGVSFSLNVWLLLRSMLSAGAAGWWSSVLRFLAFLSFLYISTWPAHPAHQAFIVSANLLCH